MSVSVSDCIRLFQLPLCALFVLSEWGCSHDIPYITLVLYLPNYMHMCIYGIRTIIHITHKVQLCIWENPHGSRFTFSPQTQTT